MSAQVPAHHFSPVPPQVAAAAAAADELLKQTGTDPLAPPADKQDPQPGDAQPTHQREEQLDLLAPFQAPPAEPPPVQPPPPARKAPPAAPPATEDETYRHRFESAQGRLQKEQELVRTLNERLAALEQTIATMAVVRPPAPATPTYTRQVTPEEERDYGPEMLEVVGKQAKDVLQPEIMTLKNEIEDLKHKVGVVGATMSRQSLQTVEQRLDGSVPGWREQNNDPAFIQWLAEVDPFSGRMRQDMLSEAHSRHDARRVVAFFEGYRSETAAVDPPSTGPAPPAQPAKRDLKALAAPGRATSPPTNGAAGDKPIYTSAQIARAYADKTAGRLAGREAEFEAWERDLIAAGREGRIR
jgi:hypothetical protein